MKLSVMQIRPLINSRPRAAIAVSMSPIERTVAIEIVSPATARPLAMVSVVLRVSRRLWIEHHGNFRDARCDLLEKLRPLSHQRCFEISESVMLPPGLGRL